MTFNYTTPTNLAGTTSGLNVDLTWSPSSLIPTVLLLHCDGVNGSTSFADSSGYNNVATAVGTAQIDTSGPHFGTGAMKMVSNTDSVFVPCPNGGPLDLSSGDFTVEFWFKSPTISAMQEILEMGMGAAYFNGGLFFSISSTFNVEVIPASGIGITPISLGIGALANNTWYHMATCSQGGYLTLYLNGNYLTNNSPINGVTWAGGDMFMGKGKWFHTTAGAEFDEIRVTKGVALYPQNLTGSFAGTYTVPAVPFTAAPPGYDVYRNGVSIGAFTGGPAFVDTPPGFGTYTYKVAAFDGVSQDISAQSLPLTFVFSGAPVITHLETRFVGPVISKAIAIASPGDIHPRIYPPEVDSTVRMLPPRILT